MSRFCGVEACPHQGHSPGQNESRERGFEALAYERLFPSEIPDALTLAFEEEIPATYLTRNNYRQLRKIARTGVAWSSQATLGPNRRVPWAPCISRPQRQQFHFRVQRIQRLSESTSHGSESPAHGAVDAPPMEWK